MINLIIFDFDGPLCGDEGKQIHFDSLNFAIRKIAGSEFEITEAEHLSTYDGKKTWDKLHKLTKDKGLDEKFHKEIWNEKQSLTEQMFEFLKPNPHTIEILDKLKQNGTKLACCSNSTGKTLTNCLDKLGILAKFDLVLSNESVEIAKPAPFIYWKAMMNLKELPENTLIIEDSPTGLIAAIKSGANVMRVKDPNSYTFEQITNYNQKNMATKWVNKKMNTLVLMAGKGSRFAEQGYFLPKFLIDVEGQPMIKRVVDSLQVESNFIFVVQKEHREKYSVDSMLNLLCPNCIIVEVDEVTEGAACSALLAKDLINNDSELLIINSDQIISYDALGFFYKMQEQNLDGGVLTFENISPKWSYVKTDENGFIVEVAEKNPISTRATVGIYFWKNGSEFVWAAEKMISENKRTRGEFYVFPATQEAIDKGLKFKEFAVDEMWGVGTPEDLTAYLNR